MRLTVLELATKFAKKRPMLIARLMRSISMAKREPVALVAVWLPPGNSERLDLTAMLPGTRIMMAERIGAVEMLL